jgi:gamma-glutamyl hercynylcysteine S-oxide synthase
MTALHDAAAMRKADAPLLAQALADGRAQTLALFAAMRKALKDQLHIRYGDELNPPLWELGHIGWFEEFWIARNTQRLQGTLATVEAPRAASLMPHADGLFNSSTVAHTKRWHLDLPSADRTVRYLDAVRGKTSVLLAQSEGDDDSLYFFRLALFHEDMHHEAALMMAQVLGLSLDLALPGPRAADSARQDIEVGAALVEVGAHAGGFAFDNELGEHDVQVEAFRIDSAPITWGAYLPFIEAGGYDEPRYWTETGWSWLKKYLPQGLPRYVTRGKDGGHGDTLQRATFGQWRAIDIDAPAMNLSQHEAAAWCRWAGRRLPTEHEWCLASQQPGFEWGQVWEWTASPFAPFPGFVPHPYRDYSQPWFDGRPVLKGGSWATAPRMKLAAYRNYFPAGRNDVFAGFRSCVI